MAVADEQGGRLIAGRFRLRSPLGSGGMGEVWDAYDERLDGRRVAVKMITDERVPTVAHGNEAMETRRKRFLREVRTTALIDHPGVPAVYDAGVDHATGRLFLAMQLLHGRELRTLIDEPDPDSGPLTVARGAAIIAQIASVLDEVHRHDVVHRDIKPENLMLTPGGILKVMDYGVAALFGAGDTTRLTQVGMTVGTPPYMSPEQALGNAVGPTSDVYAAGCVGYEVLTGHPPFARIDENSHQWHHVRTDPRPIRSPDLRPDVPREMSDLLLAMLDKDAENRPTAAEVYEALLPLACARSERPFPVDIVHLDPALPFIRPLGSRVHGGSVRGATMSAPDTARGLTATEVEEIGERAGRLVLNNMFEEAFDLLMEARERTTDPDLANDLTFRLAVAKYVAGDHTTAADLFTTVDGYLTSRRGADDAETLSARYYLAQCRAEMGEIHGAIRAFGSVADVAPDPADAHAVDRHLDAFAWLVRLYAVTRQWTHRLDADRRMREAIRRYQPADAASLLAQLDAHETRMDRFRDGSDG
ncbi:serine/threonine-protein kinase [Thermomonospora umbrina]|uniref:non-specific serine/threonine protein kinase n=1 Tax=Thermomonospora umbrina TaxID=111806 RepID=A0A3D9SPT3_9ACTN|nr:serine/threonine-protein kinase [Thermomonospora umbrina]REE95973.1 serine/threonine protein kinase [Thermomonospora umbrina]